MEKIIVVLMGFATFIFISFLLSWPVMALWNGCLVDAVTGIKEITWLQGWGISILCGILFNKSK